MCVKGAIATNVLCYSRSHKIFNISLENEVVTNPFEFHVNTRCKLQISVVHLQLEHPIQLLISSVNRARFFFSSYTLSSTLHCSLALTFFLILWWFSLVQALLLTFLATVFRCRCFITQPCFTWACAQKQCDRPWHRSLISCSQTKGWVMHVFSWEHPGDSLQGGVSCHPLFHSPFISPLRHGNRVCSALEYIWGQVYKLDKTFPMTWMLSICINIYSFATLKSYEYFNSYVNKCWSVNWNLRSFLDFSGLL